MAKIVFSVRRIVFSTTALFCLVSFPIISPNIARSQTQEVPSSDRSPAATDEATPNQTETTPGSTEASPTPTETTPNSNQTISPTTVEEGSDATGGATNPGDAVPATTTDVAPTSSPDPAGTSDPTPSTTTDVTEPQPVRALW